MVNNLYYLFTNILNSFHKILNFNQNFLKKLQCVIFPLSILKECKYLLDTENKGYNKKAKSGWLLALKARSYVLYFFFNRMQAPPPGAISTLIVDLEVTSIVSLWVDSRFVL